MHETLVVISDLLKLSRTKSGTARSHPESPVRSDIAALGEVIAYAILPREFHSGAGGANWPGTETV